MYLNNTTNNTNNNMCVFKKRDVINSVRFNSSQKLNIDLRDLTLKGSDFQSVYNLLSK